MAICNVSLNTDDKDDSTEWNPSYWRTHQWIWFSMFWCTFGACCLTAHLIMKHCSNFSNSRQQRCICRILLMVPIYSGDSWLSLRFFRQSVYFDTARDCYEAVVIYTFFQLLVLYLGGEGQVSALFRSKRVKLLFPLNCFEVHSDKLYTWCKRGCLQYVIIRPITTFAAVLAQINNVLCPGTIDPRFGYVWINVINLASVTVAMYTLVLVYVITSEKLQPFSPIPKFWAIKSIIFLSFWQQIIVVAMQKAGLLDRFESQYFTADNIADGIQNVCICIEMLFCAVAHIYAFSYKPYITTPYTCSITAYSVTKCCGRYSDAASCFLFVLNPVDLWQDFVAFVKLKSAEVKMRLSHIGDDTTRNSESMSMAGVSPLRESLLAQP